MRDMFDNMYTVRIANSGDVAGFPRSHDGLENAITLASREGTEVTCDGEVVWEEEEAAAEVCWCKFYESCPTCFGS